MSTFRGVLATTSTVILITLFAAPPVRAQAIGSHTIEGSWQGTLQGMLRIVVHVKRGEGGALAGTLDSPDQGAMGLPLDSLAFAGDSLRFELRVARGAYAGRMSTDGAEIAGQWSQGGFTLPLTLRRQETPIEMRRPQEPKRPYPYAEDTVRVQNREGGVSLAGTLTLPAFRGPFPCAVLVTGSGPEDRDETVFGHRPFLVLADHLTRQGIAVLRLDDRGVGGSSGRFATATTEDFASDVLAAVRFLKTRREIDAKRIGLVGHSEGGLIAPIAAVRSKDIAFLVLMAGPGLPGEEVLYAQGALIARAQGASEEYIAAQRRLQERLFAVIKDEADTAVAVRRIREAFGDYVAVLPDEQRRAIGDGQAIVESQVRLLRSPWFRYFLTHDPRPTLRRVRVPVLALNGEKDLQVPPRENLAAIEAALGSGGNRDVTVKELPGLNHLFQTATTGAVTEYARIEETIAPAALEEMSRWILSRSASKR